jgi:hypothetical protein
MLDSFLATLNGRKVYLAAIGLAALAVYQFTQHNYEGAFQSASAALTAAGLRHALDKTPTAVPPATPPAPPAL